MRTGRNFRIISVFVFAAAALFLMCVRTGAPELLPVGRVAANLLLSAKLEFARLLKLPLYASRDVLIAASPYYLETAARFRGFIVTALCGASIAVCGAVFQTVLRNPIAAPSMLGAGSGAELGMLILVLQFSNGAYAKTTERYVYCIIAAFALLALTLFLGRISGGKTASALIAGAVISQIAGVVMTYYRFTMTQEDLEVLQTLTLYGFTMNTTYSFARIDLMILILTVSLCLIYFTLLRFSINAVSLPEEETRALGINPLLIKIPALILCTVLTVIAILHCGAVGIIALAIPHVCRFLFGAQFGSSLFGCAVAGATALIICRIISSFIIIGGIGALPIGPLAGVICSPLIALTLAKNKGERI
jgi:iron complex transport system permease protein